MNVIEAIVLGIVQGLTEFLPISSSGHLILVPWLFGWESNELSFDAALHLGTLIAVFGYFRKDILNMIVAIPLALRHPLRTLHYAGTSDDPALHDRTVSGKIGLLIVLGSIPGGIVGLLSQGAIDDFFHDADHVDRAVAAVAVLLILFAFVLWWADKTGARSRRLAAMGWKDAAVVGLAQCLALVPGVSRSGITLSAGLFRGITRADAARFSFLLGIPLVAVAGLSGVVDIVRDAPSSEEIVRMVAGMISAALSGWLAISALLRFLQHSSTRVFVIYRVVAGLLVLLILVSGLR
ncbi:MAG: undecaprenyl-diphosphate phosphatase [Thermomicrobiales bacterium]|nr:undecaprenyl-diphosphate phosphatase [Thermomicrobiales bacterium]